MMRIIEITTARSCPVNCYPHCPQRVLNANYKGKESLEVSDFKNALSNTPADVTLDFSGFVEPFANPHTIEMMEMSKDRGYQVWLDSTLVGLKPEDVDRLANIDLPGFFLHLPDPYGIAHIPMTEDYKETLMRAFTKLQISGVSIMNKYFESHYRAGNCDNSPVIHNKGPIYCSTLNGPHFVMLPDGTCVICCMDFGLKHVVGNIFTTRFDELRRSDEFQKVWRNRLEMDGETLCRTCSQPIAGRYLLGGSALKATLRLMTTVGLWPKGRRAWRTRSS